MRLITRDELKGLIDARMEPCISIYAPMGVHPSFARGNAIRFKNLLSRVVEELGLEWNKRSTDAKELIEPLQRLLKEDAFWQNQSGGLCAFAGPGFFRYYRIPLEFEEMVHIDDHFYTGPLLPLFTGDGRFYLLSLSQQQVRLFEGTHYRLKEMVLGDLPDNREDALRFHNKEKHLIFHTRSAGNAQERDAMFHGHGSSSEDSKKNIALFFEKVDRHLMEILEGESSPLILAGVDFMRDCYKEVSHYAHILNEGIAGNHQRERIEGLHRQAWDLVKNVFKESIHHDAARFRNLRAIKESSDDIKEIIVRAFEGKVSVLFVPEKGHIWGEFDRASFHVNVFPVKINGDDDLLELTSEQTIIHRGSVYAVKPDEIPGESGVAAIFRQGIV
ncbi:MAG: hypothetical protein AB1650_09155 [Candidatus Omnitrophota bacterium]